MNDTTSPLAETTGLRLLRGISGVFAGGLVVLAIAVALAQWLVTSVLHPGPGPATVTGHIAAALAAVVLQAVADRAQGPRAALASCAVLVLAVAVLWFGWWR